MVTDSDAELVRSVVQDGNQNSFRLLVEKYSGLVFNLALRMLNNREDAEDVSQDVFIKLYRGLGRYRGEGSLSTWIYRITVNVIHDVLRHRRRQAPSVSVDDMPIEEFWIPDTSPGPEELVVTKASTEAILEALGELPENYRVVVLLRDRDGLSYEEIARILNTREGTVKSRLFRGRLLLKDILIKSSGAELSRTGERLAQENGKEA
jgi:RNA polymerase sigma-70 factor (ECF subfamily)